MVQDSAREREAPAAPQNGNNPPHPAPHFPIPNQPNPVPNIPNHIPNLPIPILNPPIPFPNIPNVLPILPNPLFGGGYPCCNYMPVPMGGPPLVPFMYDAMPFSPLYNPYNIFPFPPAPPCWTCTVPIYGLPMMDPFLNFLYTVVNNRHNNNYNNNVIINNDVNNNDHMVNNNNIMNNNDNENGENESVDNNQDHQEPPAAPNVDPVMVQPVPIQIGNAAPDRQLRIQRRRNVCKFCYDRYVDMCRELNLEIPNLHDQGMWNGHRMRIEGFIACPHLYASTCSYCGATKTNAHTDGYCQQPQRRHNRRH